MFRASLTDEIINSRFPSSSRFYSAQFTNPCQFSLIVLKTETNIPLGNREDISYGRVTVTVTKIKQERTIQDRTKIGPFVDFLQHFSIFLLKIFRLASQLRCETMFKILSINNEKCGAVVRASDY